MRIGHICAAELILSGLPFDAERAAGVGNCHPRLVPDQNLMTTATEAAGNWRRASRALQASKRLLKRPFREQIKCREAEAERGVQFADSFRRKRGITCGILEKHRPPAESCMMYCTRSAELSVLSERPAVVCYEAKRSTFRELNDRWSPPLPRG